MICYKNEKPFKNLLLKGFRKLYGINYFLSFLSSLTVVSYMIGDAINNDE